MCPACYINGLLLLIFGASGAAVVDNIYFQLLMAVVTLGGMWWMYKAYQRNKGKGGLTKNIKNTIIYLLLFAAGYVTAAYQTHSFWAPTVHDQVIQDQINN